MNNNNKSPFCKVCFDSGKPDTKHWVKDRNNKVCCPTLLALKCRLCGQCGHTVKYCSKAVAPPPSKMQTKPTYKEPVEKKALEQKAPINKFDLLFSDDDSDDDQEEQEPEPEPEQQKKQEPEQKKPSPAVKRWIDYDSDSDDEQPLPIPTLKRYGHSDKSDDSMIDASM